MSPRTKHRPDDVSADPPRRAKDAAECMSTRAAYTDDAGAAVESRAGSRTELAVSITAAPKDITAPWTLDPVIAMYDSAMIVPTMVVAASSSA
jgi:hypothetical protein